MSAQDYLGFLAELKQKSSGLKAQWEAEKSVIMAISRIKEEAEAARLQAEDAKRRGDLQKAAELEYGTLHELGKLPRCADRPEVSLAHHRTSECGSLPLLSGAVSQ